MTKEEEFYYTTIGHIKDEKRVGGTEIRALCSLGIAAYTYKMESTNMEEFLEKVDKNWNIIKHNYEKK